ncbi:hypothetical protein A3C57_02740 [Candidatus Nomurabacteria bacterium RIFCSPHIGHO2_02_FULL_33_12]|uniref:Uncharacterized protein n=1 Tax=Candidatus Nomurabacteria bacterium RIFCSPLOWO2_01_FULL_33_17 TaxID=1801764 RepID=A0A1F6WPC0_9BACT|nr:MAG: hypothetical protein A3C57_02740 [Candidatus Nomurabacteria bacterium RIFCSPHIGHO2_02_FULL_33_12]OGI83565.1 MAG: hypothetical protein A2903_02500 [Candidatus Nomurabacteria bacterium RIFCSPLOWO2_01_FULL_33_17]
MFKIIIGLIFIIVFFFLNLFYLQLLFLIGAIFILSKYNFIILPFTLIYDFVFASGKFPIYSIITLGLILLYFFIKKFLRD